MERPNPGRIDRPFRGKSRRNGKSAYERILEAGFGGGEAVRRLGQAPEALSWERGGGGSFPARVGETGGVAELAVFGQDPRHWDIRVLLLGPEGLVTDWAERISGGLQRMALVLQNA